MGSAKGLWLREFRVFHNPQTCALPTVHLSNDVRTRPAGASAQLSGAIQPRVLLGVM